jgi:hypothetical protein
VQWMKVARACFTSIVVVAYDAFNAHNSCAISNIQYSAPSSQRTHQTTHLNAEDIEVETCSCGCLSRAEGIVIVLGSERSCQASRTLGSCVRDAHAYVHACRSLVPVRTPTLVPIRWHKIVPGYLRGSSLAGSSAQHLRGIDDWSLQAHIGVDQ